MPYGLGRRLRFLVEELHGRFGTYLSLYPDVQAAVVALESAVNEAFPRRAGGAPQHDRAGRPAVGLRKRLQQSKWKLQHARRCNGALQKRLNALQVGKDKAAAGRMTPSFITKVALSWPTTCARNFAASWRDLVGVGISG